MKSMTTLEEVYELLERVDDKLAKIKEEIREMKGAELEVRPEYLEKLKKISKEKGKVYNSIEEFNKDFGGG